MFNGDRFVQVVEDTKTFQRPYLLLSLSGLFAASAHSMLLEFRFYVA
jgi:hypothetical protein